jgi:hypothetical protein
MACLLMPSESKQIAMVNKESNDKLIFMLTTIGNYKLLQTKKGPNDPEAWKNLDAEQDVIWGCFSDISATPRMYSIPKLHGKGQNILVGCYECRCWMKIEEVYQKNILSFLGGLFHMLVMHCSKECADQCLKQEIEDSKSEKINVLGKKTTRPETTYKTVDSFLHLFDKAFQMDADIQDCFKVFNYFDEFFGPIQSLLLNQNRSEKQNNQLKMLIKSLHSMRKEYGETLRKSHALFSLVIPEIF